jgi:uncharacterized protein (DUF305 family)
MVSDITTWTPEGQAASTVTGVGSGGRAVSRRSRAASVFACVVITAVAVSGCGGPDGPDGPGGPGRGVEPPPAAATSGDSPGSTAVGYEDITFVQMMLAHDRQTVQICDLLLAKTGVDPPVRVLAEQMRSARLPEIDRMAGWLAAWGIDESPLDHAHAGRTHGLLLPGQLATFERATGPKAQQAFVETMISHDQGALEISATVLAIGTDPGVKTLAESTVVAGKSEIARLETMPGR